MMPNHTNNSCLPEQFSCLSITKIDLSRKTTIRSKYFQVVKTLNLKREQLAVRDGIVKKNNKRYVDMVCCIYNHKTKEDLDDETRKQFCELLNIPDEVLQFEVPEPGDSDIDSEIDSD